MQLGSDKCAYLNRERGNQKSLGKFLTLDKMKLAELTEDECYKYLGQDENIGDNDVLNKERVIKEYMKRIRKIWSSELYSNNKIIAHNTFSIPVLTPTFGIVTWKKDQLEQMDVKTRKILSCNGSFHVNSDIDRLYTERDKGGRGLNSIADVYIARIISISSHLIKKSPTNKYLNLILNHEQPTLVRPANELLKTFNICSNDTHSKEITLNIKNQIKNNHHECWLKKSQHGYLFKSYDNIPNKNEKLINEWLKKGNLSSHIEGYICAIQEEEINTRYLK